jgi:hypothetical protein
MTSQKWSKPPILIATLKLQNLLHRMKRVELQAKIDRVSGLLALHTKRAKRESNG